MADRDGVRLHVVTGKGGTGKTTVAGALALALAARGDRVLLCEVEGRQGLARLFDVPPLPYAERRLVVAPGYGDVYGLAVDPEEALLEYLRMYYHLGPAGRLLDRFGVVDFATTVAPGLRDLLVVGKVYEAVRRGGPDAPTYAAVVLDAPPAGRVAAFLNIGSEVAELAKVGPIRSHAKSMSRLLRSPRTLVHLVTLLEEMPVQETVDTVGALRSVGLAVGSVVVNQVRQSPLADLSPAAVRSLDRDRIAKALDAVQLDPALVDGLVAQAADDTARMRLEQAQRRTVAGLGRPTAELPRLTHGVDVAGVYELADRLAEQGLPAGRGGG